jgi:3-oxoacyl-[acyl-carrier protein] reductase
MKGKVTIVTGAAQGIGRSIAELIADKGSDIVIFDIIDGSDAVAAIEGKGRRCVFYNVDVSNFQAAASAIDQAANDMGKIDNLVNNAGITIDKLLVRMKEDDWDRIMSVNLKSVFNCTRAVVRHMLRTGGSIVNISSVAGVMGNPGQANYAASKAGIIGFTKSVAREYAERSIRVNAVAPGFIRTRMTDILDEKTKQTIHEVIPLKRLGEPEDVAKVVYFLLSDLSSYITGEVINVNGGMYM